MPGRCQTLGYKTSPRFADIIDLAKSSLMQILEDAEKLRSKNNLC
ncbi:hypothetical protein [Bacteroides thetaiotaomicron]